ncbi:MAG: HNH endonuclease [Cetobacterium sp.]
MLKINLLKGFEDVNEKYHITTCGKVLTNANNSKKKYLCPNVNGKGYCQVVLYKKDNSKIRPYIHKLVALAFLPNVEDLEQVDHINNNKKDNFLNNLSWISNKNNNLKKVILDKTSNAKLSDLEVKRLRIEFEKSGKTFKDFREENYKNYKNISEKAMRYAIQKKSYFWVE